MCVTSAREATQSGPAPIALNPTPINQHKICTPLRPQTFARLLNNHPDQAFVSKLITSLQTGFDIGYSGPHSPLIVPNLHSASIHPHIVDEALEKEIQENRIAGPYHSPPFVNLRCSGLGVVPKKDGGWRLIYHLSAPTNQSINDYIDPTTYSLQYSTIDDAIKICHEVGKGALLAKVDLKNAFRLCPVRPDDWHLLGICWRGQFYVDKCLPFGLRSAPFLFNMVADSLEWILRYHFHQQYCFHYLDDFFFAGPPQTDACMVALMDMIQLCGQVGALIKPEKVIGPTTSLPLLGILLDTINQEAKLPDDKLVALLSELAEFKKWATIKQTSSKRKLLSLIGKLSFACKVIPAGRIFLRCLLNIAHSVQHLEDQVHITSEALLDIEWWLQFASTWNGKAFFLDPNWMPPDQFQLYTDASGTLGYGAYWAGSWFSQEWPQDLLSMPIEWKELYAIVMVCEAWGRHWAGKRILFHCDNKAVMEVWQSGLSHSTQLMRLVRALFFVAANGNFHVLIRHIAGVDNCIADALSRLQVQKFRQLAPQAAREPTPIPATLTFT